ncbi:protein GRAVITROPIC IN THE LIGHT 1 [Cucurbita moschata]|uniref:Protein GRAVITROPIC IN THE LIGHT 1 n=1 Tax=Cucurbita moschata TaxID=3662 RepID=A0A6J1HI83_CUCMO|nr:protein GRAVITROPIC IN THE LIGHT 1 [Cucurbita moschata]
MPDMDGSSNYKSPQISEMFQKFALAFKTKTFEFFADDDAADEPDGFSLLDSAEEVITDQKVVVIKPDSAFDLFPSLPSAVIKPLAPPNLKKLDPVPDYLRTLNQAESEVEGGGTEKRRNGIDNTEMIQTLVSSIFATISSFEASYIQLQTAHVPFVEEKVTAADRVLVSHLQQLSDFKRFYKDYRRNPDESTSIPVGSCLEAQVQENQSKLRTLGTVSDRAQSEIDRKDSEVLALRKKLGELQKSNSRLSKKLSVNLNAPSDVLMSVRVFDSILHDACRATYNFTKVLMELMKKASWDMDLAANSVHREIGYAKKAHNRYAFLSYVCLGMFRSFDSEIFGVGETESFCNEQSQNLDRNSISLKQLLEHVSSNPMELLSVNPQCAFSKFCERKYQELIHPTMESSIFSNLDRKEDILKSWRSVSVFYKSFIKMASSVWMLHKLAFSFDPVVEVFQVEKGAEFSMVYMEDVTRRYIPPFKSRAKVGFTVVPGFKIGRTVIQSQVYLEEALGKG